MSAQPHRKWRKRKANPAALDATADFAGLLEQNARGWLQDGVVLVRDEPGARLLHRNGVFGQLPGSDRLTNIALLRRRPERTEDGQDGPDLRLHLALDEAYFLAARLGCLRVIHNDRELSVRDLWRACCEEDGRFPWLYRVYRHFREKGWVPKGGLRFGADYVLYRDIPDLCHSEYAVVVVRHPGAGPPAPADDPAPGGPPLAVGPEGAGGEGPEEGGAAGFPVRWRLDVPEGMSWTELQRLSRLSSHVSKELVVAHVYEGPGEAARAGGPGEAAWLEAAEVREVLARRWVPEQSRE